MKTKILIAVLVLMVGATIMAQNYGHSVEGRSAIVTFKHSKACDSAIVVFGYPDSTNWYDSVKVVPAFNTDSTVLYATSDLDLDSIGSHVVKVDYYEKSASSISGTEPGQWLHDYSSYELVLKIDTTNAWMGMGIGYSSNSDYGLTGDTVWIVMNGDTIGIVRTIHASGTTKPDSTIGEAKP